MVTGKMRGVLLDWLIEVHLQFKLLQVQYRLLVSFFLGCKVAKPFSIFLNYSIFISILMPCLITANLYCLKAILIAVQICGIFWGWSNILRHLYCNYTANLYLVDTVHICLSFGTLCILKCFVLFQETLYMTIFLIDRYLQVEGLTLKRDQLQLVGVTAMFTACKVAYL